MPGILSLHKWLLNTFRISLNHVMSFDVSILIFSLLIFCGFVYFCYRSQLPFQEIPSHYPNLVCIYSKQTVIIHNGSFIVWKSSFLTLPRNLMQGKDGEDYGDKKPNVTGDDSSNDDIVESDVELDNSEVVEPDNDPPQKVGSSKNTNLVSPISLSVYLHFYLLIIADGRPVCWSNGGKSRSCSVVKSKSYGSNCWWYGLYGFLLVTKKL